MENFPVTVYWYVGVGLGFRYTEDWTIIVLPFIMIVIEK